MPSAVIEHDDDFIIVHGKFREQWLTTKPQREGEATEEELYYYYYYKENGKTIICLQTMPANGHFHRWWS